MIPLPGPSSKAISDYFIVDIAGYLVLLFSTNMCQENETKNSIQHCTDVQKLGKTSPSLPDK